MHGSLCRIMLYMGARHFGAFRVWGLGFRVQGGRVSGQGCLNLVRFWGLHNDGHTTSRDTLFSASAFPALDPQISKSRFFSAYHEFPRGPKPEVPKW